MTREQMPAPRGLSPLDERLSEPERRCAQRLRELRGRIGLSSEELAGRLSGDGLRVDRTRLSKFFNGREVPRRELAARLHELIAEQEGTCVSPEEVAATRALMYAAARARSPLQAREFELADAREDLDLHRAQALREMDGLQQELRDERELRRNAEEALEHLTSRSREEVRGLTEQRDAALDRIAQLEDQIRQAGAVLRLREVYARTLDELTRATNAELELRERGGTGDLTGMCEAVSYLRDADQDEAADNLIEQVALGHPVRDVMALAREFRDRRRLHDGITVEYALACVRRPIDLFRWIADQDEPSGERSGLLTAMASSAPVGHLVRFHKACEEHGNAGLDIDLLRAMARNQRTVPEDDDGDDDFWTTDLRNRLAGYLQAAAEAEHAATEAEQPATGAEQPAAVPAVPDGPMSGANA
ncbi:hypothetical protein ACFVSN_26145 [Kitasatospora sp. NPDC057904]|uniref:helix-turn-helix domain-containing protein n=1 Tax=unclassified Kitasatospora TaxID=2633591 RepID=UPI0036D93F9B